MSTPLSSKILTLIVWCTSLLLLTGCGHIAPPLISDIGEDTTDIALEDQQAIEDMINGVIDTNEERWDEQMIVRTILSRDEAIAIAEPILFQTYGTGLITSERPYKAFLVDKSRTIMGKDLPAWHVGGVFEIIIDATDGTVINMIHGQ